MIPFHTRFRSAEPLLGVILTLPSPEIAEILAGAGFDWLFLDMEHGLLDLESVQRVAQAVGSRCPCLVRIPVNEALWYKKVLDTGVAGLIVPLVNSAAEAAQAARWSHYPPEGERSIGLGRAQGYGVAFQEYIAKANAETLLILQAEHIAAVEQIDSILATPGVDGILVGPYDLSASLNVTGQISHPRVTSAIERVRQACQSHRIPVGIYTGSAHAAKQCLAQGFSFVACGMDITHLTQAAREAVAAVKS